MEDDSSEHGEDGGRAKEEAEAGEHGMMSEKDEKALDAILGREPTKEVNNCGE